MLYWILIFLGFLILLIGCQYLLKFLNQHGILINRWIWGLLSFLILIVPHVIWSHIPTGIDGILYALCAVFAINFMIEQHAYVQQLNQ
ncbi:MULTISPECIES: hypothetical protein [Latilactobacillus]|uniref:Diacylglycerol kinase n=1 Tax=Latilactobacillus curvatus TaxID=28038 RepID=A0AAC9URI2_LATCU|nr:hypothetical protein [Latilactobacillus curvatus]AOO76207.1 hypothetical protein LCW_09410 [Latilactobacillus curvatus]ASN60880.1 diacylglycerol kinase [Latilactobacillus curvatus]KHO13041.1 hypothetical protein OA78_0988 [Latilactobacillus curvatus]MCM6844774.1 diacylglycerol kinase [Latilactobacillus curvatus]MCM6860332.1 diacylglycerol kinase [Latilactobacillus curvatus]